ncbi:MAG: asparagine synthase (glutamine-hydrolyzing) [Cytophagaceae bacterium]|nr:asparagine synthase (glutamine-hydrolyzing) [Cytophagaceae bacterium]MDW8456644.1 asparagine synthase (glutamine-hydrolyzing) [Cytophagaceae bacterium]
MCGISIILDKKKSIGEEAILRMNKSLLHRGPDAHNHVRIDHDTYRVFIGNTRLAIRDASDIADQPLFSEDNVHALSYNGELYGYDALKKKLEKKYSFFTQSDTEVLLYSLVEYGLKFSDYINGMYAFIYHNRKTEITYIARDERGIKPLYYYEDDNCLVAASEIEAILQSGLVKKELNELAIAYYLRYKHTQRPNSFFKGIHELEPGYCIAINKKSTEIINISDGETHEREDNKDLHPDVLKSILNAAFIRQYETNVPTGIMLSGGVDSTLMLALLSQEAGIKNIPTYTVVFRDVPGTYQTQDALYASKAAHQYGSTHYEVEVDFDMSKYLHDFVRITGQPVADSAALLTHLLAARASAQVKVLLSGAGADELFAGYHRHSAYYFYLRFLHKRKFLIHLFKSFSSLLQIIPEKIFRKKKLWIKFLHQIDCDAVKTYVNFLSMQGLCSLLPEIQQTSTVSIKDFFSDHHLLQSALNYDLSQYLISDVLAITDAMTMAHSVEARVPYLDKELVKYAMSIPGEYKLLKGRKWLLKNLLNQYQGTEYILRNKEGFGSPLLYWLKQKQGQHYMRKVLKKNTALDTFLDVEKRNTLCKALERGDADTSQEVWALILLNEWLEYQFT